MNVHDDSRIEPWDNFQKKIINIFADPYYMRSINEQEITSLQFPEKLYLNLFYFLGISSLRPGKPVLKIPCRSGSLAKGSIHISFVLPFLTAACAVIREEKPEPTSITRFGRKC